MKSPASVLLLRLLALAAATAAIGCVRRYAEAARYTKAARFGPADADGGTLRNKLRKALRGGTYVRGGEALAAEEMRALELSRPEEEARPAADDERLAKNVAYIERYAREARFGHANDESRAQGAKASSTHSLRDKVLRGEDIREEVAEWMRKDLEHGAGRPEVLEGETASFADGQRDENFE